MVGELDSYLSVQQLARALGLSRSGLYQLRRQGKMPRGVQIGSRRRWALSEIKDWLQEGEKKHE